MNELAFNDAEIAELFLKLHHRTLKKETVAALYNKTEGWIVGLRIVLLAIREIEDAGRSLLICKGIVIPYHATSLRKFFHNNLSGYRIYY